MAEKIICPHCWYSGEATEEKMKKKRAAVQSCPRCGNPIKIKYKPKGKTEDKKHD